MLCVFSKIAKLEDQTTTELACPFSVLLICMSGFRYACTQYYSLRGEHIAKWNNDDKLLI